MFKVGDKVRWYGSCFPERRDIIYTIKHIDDVYLDLEELPFTISALEEDEDGNEMIVGDWEDYFCHAVPAKPIEEFL